MIIEDARPLTLEAMEVLKAHKDELGLPNLEIHDLSEFLDLARHKKLSRQHKETIVGQAIVIVDQLYAHLPFKRARYGVNPVQRLRLLHSQLAEISDEDFHRELLATLVDLRDAHTFYGLPQPYKSAFAFLPFRMECFHDRQGKRRRFVVTKLMEGLEHPYFVPQVEITLWNGMPVERAVERLAGRVPGGNEAARFSRGLAQMTVRPLTFYLPPDDLLVFVQYKPLTTGDERAIALPWSVGTGVGQQLYHPGEVSSLCAPVSETAGVHKVLWSRREVYREKRTRRNGDRAAPPVNANADLYSNLNQESLRPELFEFYFTGSSAEHGYVDPAFLFDASRPEAKFGYLRIKSFDTDTDSFLQEFQRILPLMKQFAPDGLILDVRGNPGGSIQAAERILQFFTPREITPAPFHFINTSLTQEIAEKLARLLPTRAMSTRSELRPWIHDILESVSSGDVLTTGRPLTPPEDANDTGQLYHGPVLLLIDATSYSATDIFAAGFQDHEIGDIVGVDENTGGGGANRWLHDDLVEKLKEIPGLPLAPLPEGAALGFAIRRSSRVGVNAGYALEDLGVQVKPADLYRLTRNDVLARSRDLLSFACHRLTARPAYELEILSASRGADVLNLLARTKHLERLECWIDGHPQYACPAQAPEQSLTVPLQGLGPVTPSEVRMQGFALLDAKLELVSSARFQI